MVETSNVRNEGHDVDFPCSSKKIKSIKYKYAAYMSTRYSPIEKPQISTQTINEQHLPQKKKKVELHGIWNHCNALLSATVHLL